jgi:rare lipoprotein A
MNNKTWQQITTTALTTVFGISGLTLISSPVKSNAYEVTGQPIPETRDINPIARSSSQPVKEFVTTKIYQHQWNNREAATVYFQNLPFLTFLNRPQSTKSQENSASEPILRATKLALRLDELHQQQADATKISVSWEQAQQSYSIKLGDEEIVRVDGQTILPDTTENLQLDALQATNRLRRMLGNASPLQQVAGKPQPKSQLVASASNKGGRSYTGKASWYGPGFHGRPTASGERFNSNGYTAAHRSLPFGTKVRVTNLNNGRSVVVRINDRGPFHGGRIIDLAGGAAKAIGLHSSGVAPVKLQVLGR